MDKYQMPDGNVYELDSPEEADALYNQLKSNQDRGVFSNIGSGMSKVYSGLGNTVGLVDDAEYKRQLEEYRSIQQESPISTGIGEALAIISGVAPAIVAPIAGAGVLGAGLLGAAGVGAMSGAERKAEVLAETGDPELAARAASERYDLDAIGAAIPISKAGSLATRVITGGAAGALTNELDVGVQNEILKEHPELQYEELDPTRMAISFGIGGGLGAIAGPRASVENPAIKSSVDAVETTAVS